MARFTQSTREIEGVFDLLGDGEDAITAAIGFTLSRSASALAAFLHAIAGYTGGIDDVEIHFQRSERGRGRTDLEIIIPNVLHLILEAKKGWELPSSSQLELYTKRKSFATDPTPIRMIVTLSEADERFARLFMGKEVNGIEIRHISRYAFLEIVRRSFGAVSLHKEKHLLQDLSAYLNKTMKKPNSESNQVFVVSLSRRLLAPSWVGTTFVDVVERHHKYFHPVGAGWPATPVNYIGFRYDGILRGLHHVDAAAVTMDLSDVAPGILPSHLVTHPHFIYSLGPSIPISGRIPAGARVLRSNRVWAALDLLLTSATITDAMLATKQRR